LPQLADLSANNELEADDEDEQSHESSGDMFDTGDEEMEEELKHTLERLGIKIEDLEEDDDLDTDAQRDADDRDEDEKIEQRVRVKKFKVKTTHDDKHESKSSKCSSRDQQTRTYYWRVVSW